MKRVLFAATLFSLGFSTLPSVFAGEGGGGGVGNGGGAWTCRATTLDHALLWVDLVDLSEGRREFALNIPDAPGTSLTYTPTVEQWVTYAETRIQQANPVFFAEYQIRTADIQKRILVPKDSDFDRTSDILHRTRPAASTCPGGVISSEPEQLANFTTTGHLLINPELWNSSTLPNIDRAALYVHEALYWIFRDYAGDPNSVRTREIVADLFSDAPTGKFAFLLVLTPPLATPPLAPLPRPGIYGEPFARLADIEITYFDQRKGLLYVTERDRDNHGKPLSSSVFSCAPESGELICTMTSTTSSAKRNRGVEKYHLRFGEPDSFVWMTQLSDAAVRATRYRKL
ncbi:hypothetical protein WDW37_15540 [Bdellovibrionota bacterium FG-1]